MGAWDDIDNEIDREFSRTVTLYELCSKVSFVAYFVG